MEQVEQVGLGVRCEIGGAGRPGCGTGGGGGQHKTGGLC